MHIRLALLGILAAFGALAVGHLVAGLVAPAASPLLAVGSALIDLAPQPLKAFAIETFGERDKEALLAGIGAAVLLFAAGIGLLAGRRPGWGAVAIALFGVVGAVAALARPTSTPASALPALIGAAVGIGVLLGLRRLVGRPTDGAGAHPSRRRFVIGAAVPRCSR